MLDRHRAVLPLERTFVLADADPGAGRTPISEDGHGRYDLNIRNRRESL
jgi:hypothetical protein